MTNPIIYLSPRNFGINTVDGKKLLCTSITGISVILFFSPQKCAYSMPAVQEYKSISSSINGVTLAAVNIDQHIDIIKLSRQTITTIDSVPYIMLYLNGIPRQIFPESYSFTGNNMYNFITSVSSVIMQSTKSQQDKSQKKEIQKSTICYIGEPVMGKSRKTTLVHI